MPHERRPSPTFGTDGINASASGSATAKGLGQMLAMTLWFKVEIFLDSMPAVIFVRQLQQQDFMMSDGATLGGCRIRHVISQPRRLKADGAPDYVELIP